MLLEGLLAEVATHLQSAHRKEIMVELHQVQRQVTVLAAVAVLLLMALPAQVRQAVTAVLEHLPQLVEVALLMLVAVVVVQKAVLLEQEVLVEGLMAQTMIQQQQPHLPILVAVVAAEVIAQQVATAAQAAQVSSS